LLVVVREAFRFFTLGAPPREYAILEENVHISVPTHTQRRIERFWKEGIIESGVMYSFDMQNIFLDTADCGSFSWRVQVHCGTLVSLFTACVIVYKQPPAHKHTTNCGV
jgi:hypothetical protein